MSNGNEIPNIKDGDCSGHNLLMKGAYSRLTVLESVVMDPQHGLVVAVTKITEWTKTQHKESNTIKNMLYGIWGTVVIAAILAGIYFKKTSGA